MLPSVRQRSKTKQACLVLRAHMKRCGMGTARLHLRVNAQQV